MSLKRQKLQRMFRDTGLLKVVDSVRYLLSIAKFRRRIKLFRLRNPDFRVPPEALAFDAYSAPDWDFYKTSGNETAVFLSSIARRHLPDNSTLRILEWGCGPGRVIRHLPSALAGVAQVYGSDYNSATIEWCTENIPGVTFVANGLHPPLPFDAGFFDFVYSISVFTHLSEAVCREWTADLWRVARSGAIVVITTNGDSYIDKLLPDELELYKSHGVVVRGKFEEGKKLFLSCHSPAYLRNDLFKKFEVLEFHPAAFPYTGQDMWVLRKP